MQVVKKLRGFSLLITLPVALHGPSVVGIAQRPLRAGQAAGPPPFVSTIFGDNMVLQRNKPDAIWGWSDPGDHVMIEIAGHRVIAVAGTDRRWQANIDPLAAGGPYTMTVTGKQTVEFKNILVGDVWLCSGQSNMQFALRQAQTGVEDAKAADLPQIRFFTVGQRSAYHSVDTILGSWSVMSPETAGRVSAVAFYFARRVQQETHIPIGLLVDAVGGTPAESWTSIAALQSLHDFDPLIADFSRIAAKGTGPEYGNFVMHWYDDYDIGVKEHWAAPDFDDSTWKQVAIPGGFAELDVPDTPALVYFRKEFDVPDPVPPNRNIVQLGIIEKMDTVYINGQEVGSSSWVENPRRYFIRPGLLKPGKNVITIRVLKTLPSGGFMSKSEDLRMTIGDQTIPLAGTWMAKLSVDGRPPQPLPLRYQNWPVMPAVLYNGMLQPLAPLSIAGALWYQGEENSPRGYQYRRVLTTMIGDWRNLFQQSSLPFYIVQLPAYLPHSKMPTDDDWSNLRESQALVADTVPNTCLAVTIDTGDSNNIHPTNKEPAGDRLARCALANYYGEKKIAFQGPTLLKVERHKGDIRLKFAHTDGGLLIKGSDQLGEFSIAGDDQKFVWAKARIERDTVVLSAPDVPNPKEARYAWQSNPEATLFNAAGMPASPFRTDHWKLETESARPY